MSDTDKYIQKMVEDAKEKGISTSYVRRQENKQCPIGAQGMCCKHCNMGPCRITSKNPTGICGADADTIAARNFARMVAAGASAHSDHAREVALTLLHAAKGKAPDYGIKDKEKLFALARELEIKVNDRPVEDIAFEVANVCLAQFGQQEGEIVFTKRAPEKRLELWRKLGIVPRGIDREIVELMHRTTVGVDQDYKSIVTASLRTALANGWGGSMIATELQDILFGTPKPLRSKVNLGVLKDDQVNILIHGHNPLLSDMIAQVALEPEMLKKAEGKKAKGINLAGICCTANEVLMRRGVPIAGHFQQQELALTTGAVEAMVVDVQCVYSSLPTIAKCYHTDIISTSAEAHIPGAIHINFDEHNALSVARQIVERAINNYPNRKEVNIPKESQDLVAGFSHEAINYMLGGSFRSSYRPLNDNIMNGRIRGVAGVVGCTLPGENTDETHQELVKELIANDVLVIQSGCSAITCAKAGLLKPEAAMEFAGAGLKEVCETVGIPPVLHTGACVDNSRILIEATNVVREGGLGEDISDVPAAGACPAWMSEKAIAIGQYFVASGVYTIFGPNLQVDGSENMQKLLYSGLEKITGGMWDVADNPKDMAAKMIAHIDKKRKALGIDKAKERVLYDMAMRRELEV
ncbi:MAG: anaerobic carbon-monoxide dehydrogenase catalytic subunit [Actinobacteria bacterium]|nr:MAG: anaerobic carbon-monoxide dehydrogenase catalytic subunit [Actinomycetota bacterium]